MSDRVVAHFYLAQIAHNAWNQGGLSITMQVVSNEHNKEWAAATPSGKLEMTIKNPLATDLFRDGLGDEYEVLITKLPKNAE